MLPPVHKSDKHPSPFSPVCPPQGQLPSMLWCTTTPGLAAISQKDLKTGWRGEGSWGQLQTLCVGFPWKWAALDHEMAICGTKYERPCKHCFFSIRLKCLFVAFSCHWIADPTLYSFAKLRQYKKILANDILLLGRIGQCCLELGSTAWEWTLLSNDEILCLRGTTKPNPTLKESAT